MRQHFFRAVCLGGALLASGCQMRGTDAEVDRAIDSVNIIDDANLNEIMLAAADPADAAAYFSRAVAEKPDRVDLRRGLAAALIRAGRPVAAVDAWRDVTAHPNSLPEDRVGLADALIRMGDWAEAEAVLDATPPSHQSYGRYRLEAMIADSNNEWSKADAFYETAASLTNTPAGVLNNWGYSKLSRGAYADAEQLFTEALSHDPNLFTTKNNLVMARGARRSYELPIIPMSQTERAKLLHTLALAAIKQGDVATGEALLREAIETHPQHFEPAARSLAALRSSAG